MGSNTKVFPSPRDTIPMEYSKETTLEIKPKTGVDTKRRNSSGSRSTNSTDSTVSDVWGVGGLGAYASTDRKWKDYSLAEKIKRIFFYCFLTIMAFLFLYLFICSIDLMGSAFQLMSGRSISSIFEQSQVFQNPICCLMIGVLLTVLMQSSSTTTSIIITMSGAGIISVEQGIYMVMGANIGTTVTNTIVSLGQVGEKNEFRRAFAGATVHDMFNWMTVGILLPIEVLTGYLFLTTEAIVNSMDVTADNNVTTKEFLNVITDPFTESIIQIDKNVIYGIPVDDIVVKRPLAKYLCAEDNEATACFLYNASTIITSTYEYDQARNNKTDKFLMWANSEVISQNITFNTTIYETEYTNCTNISWDNSSTTASVYQYIYPLVGEPGVEHCKYLFAGVGMDDNYQFLPGWPTSGLSEGGAGVLLLVLSLVIMMGCLLGLVKVLGYMLKGPLMVIVYKVINYNGTYTYKGEEKKSIILSEIVGYLCILIGMILTILVQSSSVFTSTLTPFVGMGIITVERMYPLTMGSNLGTTTTGLLAAFANDPDTIQDALQVSLAHCFFNITGLLMFYPIPFTRKAPIIPAKGLGNISAEYRWFSIVYLIGLFFLIPLLVFGLSIPGWYVLAAVLIPVFLLCVFIAVVNVMQTKKPKWLPKVLRSWDFLPIWLRSLQPYDEVIRKTFSCKVCQIKLVEGKVGDGTVSEDGENGKKDIAEDTYVNMSSDSETESSADSGIKSLAESTEKQVPSTYVNVALVPDADQHQHTSVSTEVPKDTTGNDSESSKL